MLRIDRKTKSLARLGPRSLADAGIRERTDLQTMVKTSPDAFFEEIGESLLLVGEEVRPSDLVGDRIDLLALDEQGSTVIIELKRGSDRLQLLQAITYAAMVASWSREQILAERARLSGRSAADAEDDLAEFLEQSELAPLNQQQRIMLMAEDFDWEVLATAEWLNERFGVDIRCYRLALSQDGSAEYLSCTCIYPPPELTEHVKRRREPGAEGLRWSSWDEVLEGVTNQAMVAFFRTELGAQAENRLRYRSLIYRCQGRRVLFVDARQKHAHVWQAGRFDTDVDVWREILGGEQAAKEAKGGRALSFVVSEPAQFERLAKFLRDELPKVRFLGRNELPANGEGEG